MRTRKRSQEELNELRRTLVSRLHQGNPPLHTSILWIREALGLSQEAFGELIGLSKPQVSRLEKGQGNPTVSTLQAIGRPFGLKLGFFSPDFPGRDVPQPSLKSPSGQSKAMNETDERNVSRRPLKLTFNRFKKTGQK